MSQKRIGRQPAGNEGIPDAPKNIEEYLRANNAHLQVILRQQATILTHLDRLYDMVEFQILTRLYDLSDKASMEADSKVRRTVIAQMIKLQEKMLRTEVNTKYLQLSIEKLL